MRLGDVPARMRREAVNQLLVGPDALNFSRCRSASEFRSRRAGSMHSTKAPGHGGRHGMERPDSFRLHYISAGAIAAAVAGWLIPADSWAAKVVMVVLAWGFFTYGAWSLREAWSALAQSVSDIGE